jgi:hypothetical protein
MKIGKNFEMDYFELVAVCGMIMITLIAIFGK